MAQLFRVSLFSTLVLCCSLGLVAQAAKKNFSYDEVFGTARNRESAILRQLPEITGWADDEHYLEVRTDPANGQRRVFAVNAVDGNARVYRDYSEIQKNLPEGFKAQNHVASLPDLTGFVFERAGDLYHYETEHFRRLTATPAKEENPRFSPDGKKIAYTRSGNLFVYDLKNSVEHQYTADGSGTVYNGWASWVYFEEILGRSSNYAAFWWSPDSTKLAFMRFDDAPVPVFPIYHGDGQHGTLETQHYPKAGD